MGQVNDGFLVDRSQNHQRQENQQKDVINVEALAVPLFQESEGTVIQIELTGLQGGLEPIDVNDFDHLFEEEQLDNRTGYAQDEPVVEQLAFVVKLLI